MATSTEYTAGNTNPLSDLAKGVYGWQTLEMLSRGASQGYYVPGLGGVGNAATWAGRKFGFQGTVNTMWKGGKVKRWRVRKMGIRTALSKIGKARSPFVKLAIGRQLTSKVMGLAIKGIWLQLGLMVAGAAWKSWDAYATRLQSEGGLELGGYFPETTGSATSRQRTLSAITSSRLQARSAIGNEAMLMHR